MSRKRNSTKTVFLGATTLLLWSFPLDASGENPRHPSYCTSAWEIAPMIEDCPDNRHFSDAADRCMEQFTAEVNSVTQSLTQTYAANSAKSNSAQDSKQRNSSLNLSRTDAGLRGLLTNARLVRRDLKDYVTTIILPGHPSYDMLAMYNIYDMLADSSCYKDSRLRLESQISWIEEKIAELERADGKTNALNRGTINRLGGLANARENRGPASLSLGKGMGKVSGKSPPKSSTISGKILKKSLP